MIKVYIAAPYTNGDTVQNVRRAIEIADFLADLDYAPFIPHLTHFWHFLCPHEWEFWLAQDNAWLSCCDCVLRLSGDSTGADIEVKKAREMNIPVFNSIEDLIREMREAK